MAERLDVIVIGAGLVGLAIARTFSIAGRDVVVIDRNTHIASETSARNSEVIHAGLYYPPGSLKARTCVDGRRLLYRYCADRNVTVEQCGKIIVATTTAEVPALKTLMARAKANGVDDLVYLSEQEALAKEPNIACVAAFFSPSSGVINSHGFARALETDLQRSGATIVLHTTAISLKEDGDAMSLATRDPSGQDYAIRARTVINAAGHGAHHLSATLFKDRLKVHTTYRPPKPFFAKGHYFDYTGSNPFSHLIYPMPTPHALGIHLTLGIDGSAKFGPDLSWVDEPDYAFDDPDGARHQAFVDAIRLYWPDIQSDKLHPGMTGIRPKISGPGDPSADFAVHGEQTHGVPGYVALYGIESPGLTASLSLAKHVVRLADTAS